MAGLPESLTRTALFQRDVLTAQQLLAAGVSSAYLQSQVRQGNWQRLYRGVYAAYPGEPPRLAWLWAAVLWAGEDAMLSYDSAAELAGLADKPARIIHVTVPTERTVTRVRGVVIHRSARASRRGIRRSCRRRPRSRKPCWTWRRPRSNWTTRSAGSPAALGRRLTTQAELRAALALRPRIRRRTELTWLLSPDAEGLHSVLEYRYTRDVERRHGLPAGSRQAHFRQAGRNAYRDRLYDQYLTVVELDGRATHTIDKRWDDIRRDNATSAGGILTLRYGWLDITRHPCQVAAEVALALSANGFQDARPCVPGCPVGRRGRGQTPSRSGPLPGDPSA